MVVSRTLIKVPQHQQGLILLVLVIIIMLAASTYILSELSITRIKADRDKKTLTNLKKAKQALIAYAVTYSDRAIDNDYGLLPNPDLALPEGTMAGNIGGKNTNVIGWLPWRSLDIRNLKDDSGTCLLYAVSGSHKLGSTAQAEMVNEDSVGMFRILNEADKVVQGSTKSNQVVALVIAPSEALASQVRTPSELLSRCGSDYASVSEYDVSEYLEGNGAYDNGQLSGLADTVDDFIHSTDNSINAATPYNDKFLTITREEIWDAIVKRNDFKEDMETLTLALTTCLVNYANMTSNISRRLPWPVNTSFAVTETDYRDNNKYQDESLASVSVNGYSGRFPFNVANSNAAINGAISGNNLFDIAGLCDETGLGLGVDAEGVAITLADPPETKYRKLWNNWKDHFFYTLSRRYQPNNTSQASCLLSGGAAGECISVAMSPAPTSTTEYAATVIFSGSRLPSVTRNDKTDVMEYLEDSKAVAFANEKTSIAGDGLYIYTDPQTLTKNDIMYCIQDHPNIDNPATPLIDETIMTVTECI